MQTPSERMIARARRPKRRRRIPWGAITAAAALVVSAAVCGVVISRPPAIQPAEALDVDRSARATAHRRDVIDRAIEAGLIERVDLAGGIAAVWITPSFPELQRRKQNELLGVIWADAVVRSDGAFGGSPASGLDPLHLFYDAGTLVDDYAGYYEPVHGVRLQDDASI